MQENSFTFFTDNVGFETVQTKAGKKHYVTGYISTGDLDIDQDIVTDSCMKGMLTQLKSGKIKLDVEHEAFIQNKNIIPIGMIIDAELDQKGVWVKAEINEDSPAFKSVWGSIKNGFIDAFSITFETISSVKKSLGNKVVRLLNEIRLLNVALTGNPVNKSCRIQNIFMKSVNDFKEDEKNKNKKTAGDKMTEENTAEKFEAEKKALEERVAAAEKKSKEAEQKLADIEAKAKIAEKESAEKKAAEEAAEKEAKAKEQADAEKKALEAKFEEQSIALKAIQEKLKIPVMKSVVNNDTEGKSQGDVIVGPLSFIR